MANARKTNPALAVAVAGGVIVLLIVGLFVFSGTVPQAATDPAADGISQRPTGAGTLPEGEADTPIDGITEKLDEVDPAAPGRDVIPAAERIEARGAGDGPVDGPYLETNQTGG